MDRQTLDMSIKLKNFIPPDASWSGQNNKHCFFIKKEKRKEERQWTRWMRGEQKWEVPMLFITLLNLTLLFPKPEKCLQFVKNCRNENIWKWFPQPTKWTSFFLSIYQSILLCGCATHCMWGQFYDCSSNAYVPTYYLSLPSPYWLIETQKTGA